MANIVPFVEKELMGFNIISILYLFLIVKSTSEISYGHRIVHNKKEYTHIFLGLYVRRFISLRIQTIYNLTFLNDKNHPVTIQVTNKKLISNYKNLPSLNVTKKLIWKK